MTQSTTDESDIKINSLINEFEEEKISLPYDITDKKMQLYAVNIETNELFLSDKKNLDILEFVETIELPRLSKSIRGYERIEKESSIEIKYKGVNWTNLLVFDKWSNSNYSLGIFLGFKNGLSVPDDWFAAIKVSWEFLNPDTDEVIKKESDSHRFLKPKHNNREDNGSKTTFGLDEFLALNPNYDISFKFKLKTKFEIIFSPAIAPPLDYKSKEVTGMVGLENLGATCYLNALLQMLFHINAFRLTVYQLPHEEEILQTSTTLALQNVFKNLQFSDKEVSTKDLTVAFGWTSAEAFMQQDVQEMMRVLIDKLEDKMKGTAADGYIKHNFAGTIRSYIKCVNVPYESKREEDFYDIQLDVKGCKNIYESFKRYVDNEMLDGDNKYDAGTEYGKQDAQKGVIFTKFPPVLTIHLKRFDFDMNTLGFRKIHDYYEFYERLNLDEFLAEDCPPESKTHPNNYILHSVLVHSGDVGGGHYYAYIRPSTGYNYSDISNDDESGKWFKFNDDIVLEVQSREAIQHCYGREEILSFKQSSAYMLVYIREADVGTIMNEISSEDIPRDLIKRLDNEMETRRIQDLKLGSDDLMSELYFATEKDVKSFQNYNSNQDFIMQSHMNSLQILKGSKVLGVFLKAYDFAKKDFRKFLNIRLRTIDKSGVKGQFTLRARDDIDCEEFLQTMKANRYYIEYIDEEIENEDEALVEFQNILNEESKVLNEMRQYLYEWMPNNYYDTNDDPVISCGIGMNNTGFLKDFVADSLSGTRKDDAISKIDEILCTIDELEVMLVDLLRKFDNNLFGEASLVFFKAFDPYNLFVEVTDSKSLSDDVEMNEDQEIDKEKSSNNNSNSDEAPLEYLPIKYLGSKVLRKDDDWKNLYDIVEGFITEKDCFTIRYPIDYSLCEFTISESTSSSRDIKKIIKEKSSFTMEAFLNESSACKIIMVTINPSETSNIEAYKNHTPYSITNVTDYVNYRSHRKVFVMKPLYIRDVRIVQEIDRKTNNNSSVVNDASSNNPIQTSQNFYFSVLFDVKMLIKAVAEKLRVDYRHIIVYLTNYSKNTEISRKSAGAILPMYACQTLANATVDSFIDKNLKEITINRISKFKFSIFYRIAPFPLINNVGLEMSMTKRSFDLKINDVRIKAWRSEYLKFINKKNSKKRKSMVELDIYNEDINDSQVTVTPEPIWNYDIDDNIYNMEEEDFINCCYRREMDISEIMNKVRESLGIPSNVDSFIPSFQVSPDDQEIIKSLKRSCQGDTSVLSDKIIIDDDLSECSPKFPLAILTVRHNIIDQICQSDLKVAKLITVWPEADCTLDGLFQLLVQHVPLEDVLFMRGESRECRSMLVSVFNFTLMGNQVNALSIEEFSGPFISYVREDDTLDSITARFGLITGDSDWSKCRLAVIESKTPHFIQRNNNNDNNNSNNSNNNNAEVSSSEDSPTPWGLLTRYNPDFVLADFKLSRIDWGSNKCRRNYPRIGIQRPVAETQSNARAKRFGSSGIKIV